MVCDGTSRSTIGAARRSLQRDANSNSATRRVSVPTASTSTTMKSVPFMLSPKPYNLNGSQSSLLFLSVVRFGV